MAAVSAPALRPSPSAPSSPESKTVEKRPRADSGSDSDVPAVPAKLMRVDTSVIATDPELATYMKTTFETIRTMFRDGKVETEEFKALEKQFYDIRRTLPDVTELKKSLRSEIDSLMPYVVPFHLLRGVVQLLQKNTNESQSYVFDKSAKREPRPDHPESHMAGKKVSQQDRYSHLGHYDPLSYGGDCLPDLHEACAAAHMILKDFPELDPRIEGSKTKALLITTEPLDTDRFCTLIMRRDTYYQFLQTYVVGFDEEGGIVRPEIPDRMLESRWWAKE